MMRSAHGLAGAMAVAPAAATADELDVQLCCANNDDPTRMHGHGDGCRRLSRVPGVRCVGHEPGGHLRVPRRRRDDAALRLARRRAVPARSTTSSGSQDVGADEAFLFDERVGFVLTRGFYTAFDFELGDVSDARPSRPDAHAVVVDGLVSLGLRGGLGPFVLRGELAGGAMAASSTTRDLPTELMLEARGRADFWLSPWVTVGAAVGASLIREGDWMTGIYLGFHTWSFGGDRW